MKKYVIILFALLISAVVFAENAETDVSMAKITLNTGDVFIGEIIVENEHILMIRTAEGSRFQFPINDIETIQENYAVRRIVVVEEKVALPREIQPSVDENPVIFEQRNDDLTVSLSETDVEDFVRRRELRLNILAPILYSSFEFSYELIVNNNISIGFDCGVVFTDSRFAGIVIMPYLRGFFGRRNAASGFFGEFHTLVGIFDYRHWPQHPFGFGPGIGYKFVTNNNWVIELACSISRIIDVDELLLAARFTVGRRF